MMLIGFFLKRLLNKLLFLCPFLFVCFHIQGLHFVFFVFISGGSISVCRVSVSVKYTLLGVLNLCYPNNVFENIKTDVKIRIFPIQIAYWSGFGIFKQNRVGILMRSELLDSLGLKTDVVLYRGSGS